MTTATSPTRSPLTWHLSLLSSADTIALDLATERGYLVWNPGQQPLRNAFHAWCRLNHHPFITVLIDGEQASVCLDLEPAGHHFVQQGKAFSRFVEAVEQALCDYVAGYDEQERWQPGVYTRVEGVSVTHAPSLASAMLDAWEEHLRP